MEQKEFSLFISTLKSFHEKSNDLPINLVNPILIKVEFLLDCMNYYEPDINIRLSLLQKKIVSMTSNENFSNAFLMYGVVMYIDELYNYFIEYADDLVKASEETLNIHDQKDDDAYWLTAWHPKMVIEKKTFVKAVKSSRAIWISESEKLRKALFNVTFMPPYSESNIWDILRNE